MSERRVLFIVEGERDESRFLRRMYSILTGTKPENIYVYGATVHQLLRKIAVDGRIDDDLDIVSVLMEDASDSEMEVLDRKFSDVYLIFDMDPQDSVYDESLLSEAVRFFDDSTGNGRLYLNYPMMQSYRHLAEPYDEGYLHRTVTIGQIRDGYKALVDKECHPLLKDLGKYDRETFLMIVLMNLRKADLVMGGEGVNPDPEAYLGWDLSEVLDAQRQLLSEKGIVYVLNTSVFNVVDFDPGIVFPDYEGA